MVGLPEEHSCRLTNPNQIFGIVELISTGGNVLSEELREGTKQSAIDCNALYSNRLQCLVQQSLVVSPIFGFRAVRTPRSSKYR
jgi:hypothetical protein